MGTQPRREFHGLWTVQQRECGGVKGAEARRTVLQTLKGCTPEMKGALGEISAGVCAFQVPLSGGLEESAFQ